MVTFEGGACGSWPSSIRLALELASPKGGEAELVLPPTDACHKVHLRRQEEEGSKSLMTEGLGRSSRRASPHCCARLGDEAPFHDQRAALVVEVVKAEGGVLRLDVDGKARRREEAVVLAVAPAEVGASAAREGEVGVLRGTVAMARSRDERGRGEHRAPSCQRTRTKLASKQGSIGSVSPSPPAKERMPNAAGK